MRSGIAVMLLILTGCASGGCAEKYASSDYVTVDVPFEELVSRIHTRMRGKTTGINTQDGFTFQEFVYFSTAVRVSKKNSETYPAVMVVAADRSCGESDVRIRAELFESIERLPVAVGTKERLKASVSVRTIQRPRGSGWVF